MGAVIKQEWERLCGRHTSDAGLIARLWEELEQAYTSKGRHYHTLDHLAYMLELDSKYRLHNGRHDLLLFALFYHDFIYSPSRSDNEERSAELAGKRLSELGVPAADIALVQEMILATKAHHLHPDATVNLLLDLDLAILGAEGQKYDAYSQAVRKEYGVYPDFLYRPGRRKVLQHFLSQPNIYKTPVFQQEFEEQARLNLQRELSALD